MLRAHDLLKPHRPCLQVMAAAMVKGNDVLQLRACDALLAAKQYNGVQGLDDITG